MTITISGGMNFSGGMRLVPDIKSVLYYWGNPNFGAPLASTVLRSSPVQLSAASDYIIAHVMADLDSSVQTGFAVKTDGSLWSWGDNTYGQLGLGDTVYRSSPVQIGSSSWSFVTGQILSTDGIAAGITSDNRLFIWGTNSYGVATGTTTAARVSAPVQILGSWSTVGVGALGLVIGTKTDKTLWTWGVGSYGNLMDSSTANRSSPVQVGTSSWSMVGAGRAFTLGLTVDGALYASGNNNNGQLGQGNTVSRVSAVGVSSGTSFTMVTVMGEFSVAAITTTGTLFTWGANGSGLLGDSTTQHRSTPTQIGNLSWSWVSGQGAGLRTKGVAGGIVNNALYVWGTAGPAVGTATTDPSTSAPVQIATLNKVWTKVYMSNAALGFATEIP